MGYAGIKDIRMFIKTLYKYRKMRNNSRKPVQEGEGVGETDRVRQPASKQATKSIMQQGTRERERANEGGSSAKTVML